MRKLGKKGSFADMFYIAVFLFMCGLIFTVGWMIKGKINDQWQAQDNLGTVSQEIMQDSTDTYVASFDGVFLALLVGLYLGAIVLAYNVDINPVFFFLSLLLMGVIVIITAVLGNAWYEYSINADLSTYVDDFTIIPFVMSNYVAIFVVMIFGLAGVMYAKTS